jgi:hypothetical protein
MTVAKHLHMSKLDDIMIAVMAIHVKGKKLLGSGCNEPEMTLEDAGISGNCNVLHLEYSRGIWFGVQIYSHLKSVSLAHGNQIGLRCLGTT